MRARTNEENLDNQIAKFFIDNFQSFSKSSQPEKVHVDVPQYVKQDRTFQPQIPGQSVPRNILSQIAQLPGLSSPQYPRDSAGLTRPNPFFQYSPTVSISPPPPQVLPELSFQTGSKISVPPLTLPGQPQSSCQTGSNFSITQLSPLTQPSSSSQAGLKLFFVPPPLPQVGPSFQTKSRVSVPPPPPPPQVGPSFSTRSRVSVPPSISLDFAQLTLRNSIPPSISLDSAQLLLRNSVPPSISLDFAQLPFRAANHSIQVNSASDTDSSESTSDEEGRRLVSRIRYPQRSATK